MKELSIEQKVQRYDKAFKIAQELYNDPNSSNVGKGYVCTVFPELKESEDEKIRKALIRYFTLSDEHAYNEACGVSYRDIVAWLEKQNTDISSFPKEQQMFMQTYVSLDKITLIKLLAERDANNTEIIESFEKQSEKSIDVLDEEEREFADNIDSFRKEIDDSYQKGYNEGIRVTLEKQNEQKSDEVRTTGYWNVQDIEVGPKFKIGQTIRKENFNSGFTIVKIEDGFYYNNTGDYFPFTDQDNWELVEQKFADKIELKFKVDDWVVFNNKHQSIYQVEKIEDGYYILRHTHGGTFRVCVLHDKSLRLWTIEDAKAGDVLATSAGAFIYNGNNGGGSCPGSYCGINTLGIFQTGAEHHWTGKKIYPATKEQRDTLMKAMADAGYTFDFEKKELKKISQRMISAEAKETLCDKPVWSEEDECYMSECISAIATKDGWSFEEKRKMKHWLESLKDRVQPKQKQEWSKEDERNLKRIDSLLYAINESDFEDIHAWLKSLRHEKCFLNPQNQKKKY